jgi:histone H3/H4
MTEVVVKSKIKELTAGYSVSSDFADELDAYVKQIIEKAKDRAKANGRKTIMSRDI